MIIMKKTGISSQSLRFAAMVVLTAAFLLAPGRSLFSQVAGIEELKVPPPSYASFDSSQTKAFDDYLAMPISQKGYQMMAEQLGFTVKMKIYVYVCDKAVKEVADYYASKTGLPAEIESGTLISDPSEMEEMERELGESFPPGFLDKYRAAFEKYNDVGRVHSQFEISQMNYQSGGTSISVEIENPGFNVSTFLPVNKTVIQYTVIDFQKK